jgi:hypothetical protein
MKPLGIGPRDVLALSRYAQHSDTVGRPLLVTGVLAEQLASALAAGGDRGVVVTSGDPAHAAALVRVVAGAATPDDEAQLRRATRALVPVVAVQTGIASVRLPYVLATDVIEVPAGSGFPTDEIAAALAAALGSEGAALAARLPVLRRAVERRRALDGTLTAAALAAMTRDGGPHLPALALAQARLISDLSVVNGAAPPRDTRAAAEAVAPALGAALATGVLARTLVRRLPVRGRLVEAAVAAAGTAALAALAGRIGSVRSGS